MNDLKRVLGAIGFGVCFLPGWLGVLCLTFGLAGIGWFLGTWMFVAFLGFIVGLMVVPDLDIAL